MDDVTLVKWRERFPTGRVILTPGEFVSLAKITVRELRKLQGAKERGMVGRINYFLKEMYERVLDALQQELGSLKETHGQIWVHSVTYARDPNREHSLFRMPMPEALSQLLLAGEEYLAARKSEETAPRKGRQEVDGEEVLASCMSDNRKAAVVREVAKLIASNKCLNNADGETVLSSLGEEVTGHSWYYFTSEGVFGCAFSIELLQLLRLIDKAQGEGLLRLVLVLCTGSEKAYGSTPVGRLLPNIVKNMSKEGAFPPIAVKVSSIGETT